jgi:hypothetical protein
MLLMLVAKLQQMRHVPATAISVMRRILLYPLSQGSQVRACLRSRTWVAERFA